MSNVKLAYWITFFRYTWFWLGIWAIFYTGFGGYYVIGLLETVMIVTCILTEIPTGAFADVLGKRKTLIIAFFLGFISNVWMGLSPNVFNLVLSLIVMNIGGTFASGAFEALIYDSLKDEKKESKFNEVLANISTIRLLALGISSIVGGYLAVISIRIPHVLNGVGLLIATILAFYLVEPRTDTIKATIKGYLEQNISGIKHLFRSIDIRKIIIPSLIVSSLILILKEGLDDILMLNFGFTDRPVELGYIFAIYSFVGAFATFVIPKIFKKWDSDKLYIFYLLLIASTLFFSPFVTLYVGALTVIIRVIVSPLSENHISTIVNNRIDSKFRATSLSAFSMIASMPYALTIFAISYLADVFNPAYVASVIGLLLVFCAIYYAKLFNQQKV